MNAPAGDQFNVRAEFTPTTTATLVGFCTVQDNVSFGANFRIAKSYATPGTVTRLAQGTGITLTPNPITTTGTIAVDTTAIQARVSSTCAVGSSIRVIAADGTVTCQTDNAGPVNAYVQGGNAFGAMAVLGTTQADQLRLIVNDDIALRVIPTVADSANGFDTATPSLIGGWSSNLVRSGVLGAFIGGGGGTHSGMDNPNHVYSHYGTIAGGTSNLAGNSAGANHATPFATVGGGTRNTASGAYSTVGGGSLNDASGTFSTVGGGSSNDTTAVYSTIGGGAGNVASSTFGSVGGGEFNTASGYASTVGGGADNVASGNFSVAMGRSARALGNGSFSFADSNNFIFSSSTANEFAVRAIGGVRFVTGIDGAGATTWSCRTTDGNGWSCSSDRNLKQDLAPLDGIAVLEKLAAMPVYAWSPKGVNAKVRHYGPMAQDFMAAFGLGDDDKMIGMQDADGVALAAIQGLNAKLETKTATLESQNAKLATELRERDAAIATMQAQIAELRLATSEIALVKAALARLEQGSIYGAPRVQTATAQ